MKTGFFALALLAVLASPALAQEAAAHAVIVHRPSFHVPDPSTGSGSRSSITIKAIKSYYNDCKLRYKSYECVLDYN
jgi:hypothetical protein